jgi:L-2-hydroxyglutarate oxidase
MPSRGSGISSPSYQVAVIGGGIVGMATAATLVAEKPLSLVVLEAEIRLAAHQTGHNSGVIHSGLYYKPGSLKARTCVEGREAMYHFCQEHGIPHERCGKLVVAVQETEIPALQELERRGRANGLQGLRWLPREAIAEYEPHVAGIAGLWVPETGIVDYPAVTRALAKQVIERGGTVRTGSRVRRITRMSGELVLETEGGEIVCRNLINCGGLQCDRIARLCGLEPDLKIIPFRGEYYELVPERRHLVRNLIYPVPDPQFPFLGVHFTRMIGGGVEAGPNAVLALKREGYRWSQFSLRDTLELSVFPGFWRLAAKYWKTGWLECYRSISKRAFVASLQRLIPELGTEDVHPAGAGVRAQAIEPSGKLVDDFRIVEGEHMIHVLNAPSPGATASLSIGKTIAALAHKSFALDQPCEAA